MKRDFSIQLKDLDGNGLVNNGKPFTLKDVAVGALMTPFDDERTMSGDQKFARYNLAVKINAAQCLEVSAEEITLLKSLIGKAYTPLVVGQAFIHLDADYESPVYLAENFA